MIPVITERWEIPESAIPDHGLAKALMVPLDAVEYAHTQNCCISTDGLAQLTKLLYAPN